MSQNLANVVGVAVEAPVSAPIKPGSFVHHARLISGLTLISRILGVFRESLAAKLTAIMLPYALLVCGMAFLSAILQVHHRFGWSAATPIVLNVALIVGTILGARFWDMKSAAGQTKAVYFLSLFVLAAGAVQ